MSPDGPPPAPHPPDWLVFRLRKHIDDAFLGLEDHPNYKPEKAALNVLIQRSEALTAAEATTATLVQTINDQARRLVEAEATRHQVEQERDKAVEEARMGHVRLNECAGWEATKDQPLYDRISAKIQQLVNDKQEIQHNLSALASEMDALRAEKNAAEHRRQAAEYRAQRIVLDKELLAKLATAEASRDALIAQLAAFMSQQEDIAEGLSRNFNEGQQSAALQIREFLRILTGVLAEARAVVDAPVSKEGHEETKDVEARVAPSSTLPAQRSTAAGHGVK